MCTHIGIYYFIHVYAQRRSTRSFVDRHQRLRSDGAPRIRADARRATDTVRSLRTALRDESRDDPMNRATSQYDTIRSSTQKDRDTLDAPGHASDHARLVPATPRHTMARQRSLGARMSGAPRSGEFVVQVGSLLGVALDGVVLERAHACLRVVLHGDLQETTQRQLKSRRIGVCSDGRRAAAARTSECWRTDR